MYSEKQHDEDDASVSHFDCLHEHDQPQPERLSALEGSVDFLSLDTSLSSLTTCGHQSKAILAWHFSADFLSSPPFEVSPSINQQPGERKKFDNTLHTNVSKLSQVSRDIHLMPPRRRNSGRHDLVDSEKIVPRSSSSRDLVPSLPLRRQGSLDVNGYSYHRQRSKRFLMPSDDSSIQFETVCNDTSKTIKRNTSRHRLADSGDFTASLLSSFGDSLFSFWETEPVVCDDKKVTVILNDDGSAQPNQPAL